MPSININSNPLEGQEGNEHYPFCRIHKVVSDFNVKPPEAGAGVAVAVSGDFVDAVDIWPLVF